MSECGLVTPGSRSELTSRRKARTASFIRSCRHQAFASGWAVDGWILKVRVSGTRMIHVFERARTFHANVPAKNSAYQFERSCPYATLFFKGTVSSIVPTPAILTVPFSLGSSPNLTFISSNSSDALSRPPKQEGIAAFLISVSPVVVIRTCKNPPSVATTPFLLSAINPIMRMALVTPIQRK